MFLLYPTLSFEETVYIINSPARNGEEEASISYGPPLTSFQVSLRSSFSAAVQLKRILHAKSFGHVIPYSFKILMVQAGERMRG